MQVDEQTLNSYGIGPKTSYVEEESIGTSTAGSDEPEEVDAPVQESEDFEETYEEDGVEEPEKTEIEKRLEQVELSSRTWQSRYDQTLTLAQKQKQELDNLREAISEFQQKDYDPDAYITAAEMEAKLKATADKEKQVNEVPQNDVVVQNWFTNESARVERATKYAQDNNLSSDPRWQNFPSNDVGLVLAIENEMLKKEIEGLSKSSSPRKPRKKPIPKVGSGKSGKSMGNSSNSQLSTFEKQFINTLKIDPKSVIQRS